MDYASLAAAKKVFARWILLIPARAYEFDNPLGFPWARSLIRRVPAWLEVQGANIRRGSRVQGDFVSQEKKAMLRFFYMTELHIDFEAVIVAVPWFEAPYLFSASPANFPLKLEALKQIPSAAITAVHLWFDRPINPLPQGALVGKLSQWIFNSDSYCQVVNNSPPHRVVKCEKEELLKTVLGDLGSVFPQARRARLLHWRVVTIPRAVISLQPGVDWLRPSQKTSVPGLFLAGDWTATGWPGTMEGAVWSGYLAAEGLLKYLGAIDLSGYQFTVYRFQFSSEVGGSGHVKGRRCETASGFNYSL